MTAPTPPKPPQPADPKCPDCGAQGMNNVVEHDSPRGHSWSLICCALCGHVHGVWSQS